jgi:hypothetical protein
VIDPSEMEDERELDETPPSEPAGSIKVAFDVPVPRVEQIAGQIARQIIEGHNYSRQKISSELWQAVERSLHEQIDAIVATKVGPIIEAILSKPLQPTDGFGNPLGEPTTLTEVVAKRLEGWAQDPVDDRGQVVSARSDSWNRQQAKPRIEALIKSVIDRHMAEHLSRHVEQLRTQLKAGAEKTIAEAIARRLAGFLDK